MSGLPVENDDVDIDGWHTLEGDERALKIVRLKYELLNYLGTIVIYQLPHLLGEIVKRAPNPEYAAAMFASLERQREGL